MYYYYYYYGENTINVQIEIRTKPTEQKPSIGELQEFIETLTTLHKGIIYHTQPEYQAHKLNQNLSDIELLDYHELKIEKIENNSPFLFKLSFQLLNFTANPYIALWKTLILICDRYGKNTKTLLNNVSLLNNFIEKLLAESKRVFRDNNLSELLDLKTFDNSNEYRKYLFEIVTKLLSDVTFKKYYNLSCNSIFFINRMTSLIENAVDILIPIDDNNSLI